MSELPQIDANKKIQLYQAELAQVSDQNKDLRLLAEELLRERDEALAQVASLKEKYESTEEGQGV